MLFTSITQFAVLALLLVVGWLFGFASHPGGKRWKTAYEAEAVGRAQDRDELDGQLRAQDARIAALEKEKAELESQLAGTRAPSDTPVADPEAPLAPAAPAPLEVRATPGVYPAETPAVTHAPPAKETPDHVYLSRIAPDEPTPVVAAPMVTGPIQATAAARPAPSEVPVAAEPAPALAAEEPADTVAAEPAPAPLPIKRGWFDWGKGEDLTRLRGVNEALAERLRAEGVDRFSELAGLNDQEEIALERRLDLPAGYIMKEQLREQARLLAGGQDDEHAARFGG